MRALSCGERAILSQDGPEEPDDVCRVLKHKRLVAQKRHNCDACDHGRGISPGETYDILVLLDGDQFEIKRYCNRPC